MSFCSSFLCITTHWYYDEVSFFTWQVVGYIRNKAADMQCIVITHKKEFYNSAEQLYGFYIKVCDPPAI